MANEENIPKTLDSTRKLNGEGRSAGVIRDYIAVARGCDLVVIRVVGQGTMLTAPALANFADQQLKAGFRRLVFDLERCHGLDSTFLGVMVGLQTLLKCEDGSVSAVNVPPELATLMAMLGVDKFVRIRGTYDLGQLETTMLAEKNLPSDEQRRMVLNAHNALIEIDKRNEARFGPFLKNLSQALASG